MKNDRLSWLLGILIPLVVIASIWFQPLAHYWLSSPVIEQSTLDRLRSDPPDERLREIERQNQALPLRMSDAEILDAAARLLGGELALKGYPPIAVSSSFDKADLHKGLPTWGLYFGSLAATEILTDAYEITRDDKWLTAALRYTAGFIRYERSAWLPEGFLWNDHAIAGRVSVLVKLWRVYRSYPAYAPQTGRLLLEHILRCRGLLAKKSHFTFNTNHGVMQNVALLQIAAAFPGLPDEAEFRKLAIERLDRQFAFYVSDEGVVLEHSAEYHALGVELLDRSIKLLEMLGEPAPPRWIRLHREATAFLDLIRLPDDSLPLFGNTQTTPEFPSPNPEPRLDAGALCGARSGAHLYPVSGYVVTWHCGQQNSQTVLALSQFVGHGHKHADELSLLTWTRGSRWLTSIGYWPYGAPGSESAYAWEGSNAPHWRNESTAGAREPRLLASAAADGITFLDAERKSRDGGKFRRQVLQIGSDWWIVVDFASAPASAEAEALWTLYPGIAVSYREAGAYRATLGADEMRIGIAGADSVRHNIVTAEQAPWRGWVVKDRTPTPANGILVRFPANTFLASVFHAVDTARPGDIRIEWIARNSAEDWELAITSDGMSPVRILRQPDGHLVLSGMENFGGNRLTLIPAPDIQAARAAIHAAYASLQADFPRYREISPYRAKATKLLLALFVIQEMLLLLIGKYWRRRAAIIRTGEALAWIGIGLALHLWYFS